MFTVSSTDYHYQIENELVVNHFTCAYKFHRRMEWNHPSLDLYCVYHSFQTVIVQSNNVFCLLFYYKETQVPN